MTSGSRTAQRALWHAREAAFAPGQFVGQESFVSAHEVLTLARHAGIHPGVRVLDVCCGIAGPGLLVARLLGCRYLGVDADVGAVARARERAAEQRVPARFVVARVPPLPVGTVDVVLLVETLLAFRDKAALVREVASVLPGGGRFAFTAEVGRPLDEEERRAMPAADTVWPTPWGTLVDDLAHAGLRVRWSADRTDSHRVVADALLDSYGRAARAGSTPEVAGAAAGLLASHRLWSRWLREGRVRKLAVVAERMPAAPSCRGRHPVGVPSPGRPPGGDAGGR